MQLLGPKKAPPHAAPRKRKGFTLVEVMVAGLVLLVTILSSLYALQQGFELLDTARNATTADQILQSELEDIRLLTWNEISALPASGPVTLSGELAAKFSATRTVSTVRTDMMKIKILVEWTDYKSRSHRRTYETYFGHFGLNDYFVTNRS
jgi:Tfp pilus assembly protein PilV